MSSSPLNRSRSAHNDTANCSARHATGSRWRFVMPLVLASLLGACASVPPTGGAASPVAPTAPESVGSAAAQAKVNTAGNANGDVPAAVDAAASAPSAENPGVAAGAPTDPLRPEEPVDLKSDAAHRDLWARVRRGFAMPDLDTELVRSKEQWYASRPDYVARMTERSGRYLFHIVEELERRGMPTELALLPFIESAFNPQAMSSAKASGMWQFIPSTGKDFDLRQNVFRDDRRDVLASTRAALDYLQKLYGMFGDWHLALAAYNWGEGSVSRAIARNQKAGLGTDYLSLSMPVETRQYVPKLQAVKNIIARPADFGLTLEPLDNHPYFLSVPIQRDIDAALVAKLAGLPIAEFHALNPSLNKPVILAAGTPQVLLPYDNANAFVHALPEHRGPLASWTAWVVPKTMKPSEAAQQAGMSEAALREINRIPPRMLVKAGSTLLVPRTAQRAQDVSPQLADNASMFLVADAPPMRRSSIKAKKSDTLASVARRYGTTAASLAEWNKLPVNASLKAGQSLVVYQPTARASTRKATSSARTSVAAAPAKSASTAKRTAAAKAPAKRTQAKATKPGKSASTSRASTSGKSAVANKLN